MSTGATGDETDGEENPGIPDALIATCKVDQSAVVVRNAEEDLFRGVRRLHRGKAEGDNPVGWTFSWRMVVSSVGGMWWGNVFH